MTHIGGNMLRVCNQGLEGKVEPVEGINHGLQGARDNCILCGYTQLVHLCCSILEGEEDGRCHHMNTHMNTYT